LEIVKKTQYIGYFLSSLMSETGTIIMKITKNVPPKKNYADAQHIGKMRRI